MYSADDQNKHQELFGQLNGCAVRHPEMLLRCRRAERALGRAEAAVVRAKEELEAAREKEANSRDTLTELSRHIANIEHKYGGRTPQEAAIL